MHLKSFDCGFASWYRTTPTYNYISCKFKSNSNVNIKHMTYIISLLRKLVKTIKCRL